MHEHPANVLLFFSASFLFLICYLSEASMVGSTAMPLQYLSRTELARVAGYGEERLSSVLVAGTVLCDACLAGEAEFRTSYVQGAKVAVRCKTEDRRKKVSWARGTTDEYGDFIVDLPSHLHGIPSLESSCSVRVVRAPKISPCHGVKYLKSKSLKLSSVGNSIRTYTAGVIRLENSIIPGLCTRRKDEEESTW